MEQKRFTDIPADKMAVTEDTAALINCIRAVYDLTAKISAALEPVETDVDNAMESCFYPSTTAIVNELTRYIGRSIEQNISVMDTNKV